MILTAPWFLELIKAVLDVGPIGLVLIIWIVDRRKIDEILRQYKDDMVEQRQMYDSNVELVKRHAELAGDLKDVITLNTQTMTRLVEKIDKEVCK